ncbi:MAG: hypothetical protein HOQ28_09305, partial [Thermoleophilia bacterium]|nr:hypothetical protein [Thermoleophilia bacterium]
MTVVRSKFADAYLTALESYRAAATESALRVAYELGREAVARGLSVLDLAAVHHQALLRTLAGTTTGAEAERAAASASDFFLESLSAFEMVQRGFREAREAAHLEQRQTLMLRRLSSFLADTSLALGGSGALEEVLQLVAEQARELVGASWSLACLAVDGESP